VIAMSHADGTLLTIAIIVILVLVFGVIVITTDLDWFD
jgi:inner membrane protein involved in colicin E2 resistance